MGQRIKRWIIFYLEGFMLIGAAGRSFFNFEAWRELQELEAGRHE